MILISGQASSDHNELVDYYRDRYTLYAVTLAGFGPTEPLAADPLLCTVLHGP